MSILNKFFSNKNTGLSVDKLKVRATAAQDHRQWEEAGRLWREITIRTPTELNPWLQLGNVKNELGQWDEALLAFKHAVEVDARSALPLVGIAGVYERMDRWEDAWEAWQHAALSAALTPGADTILISLHLALSSLRIGRTDRAVALLEQVANADPSVKELPLFQAVSIELMRFVDHDRLMTLGDDVLVHSPDAAFVVASAHLNAGAPQRGWAVLRPVMKVRSQDTSFLWLAADLNEHLGHWIEVFALCRQAADIDRSDQRYNERAFKVALRLGDLRSARILAAEEARDDKWDRVHALMSAYNADGQGHRARLLCRWLCRKWGHSRWHQLEYIRLVSSTLSPDLADKLIRDDVAKHGKTEENFRVYADVAFLAGNFMDATRRLEFFLETHTTDEGASVLLGYALANAVSIDAAEAHFSDVATRQFQCLGALVGLAHMSMRRRDKQATFDRWRRINSIYPEFDIGHVELARSAYEMRQMDLALNICRQRLAQVPRDATMGEFLVWFLLATGRFQEAWGELLKLQQHDSGWAVADLKLQTAAHLGILDEEIAGILALFPPASNQEAGRRIYNIVRHLVVIGREDLMARVIDASAADPTMLGWMWPYMRSLEIEHARSSASPLADRGAKVKRSWTSVRDTIRGDIADQIRQATPSEIDRIFDRPRHMQPVVHIINKLEQVSGGSELHALDIAERVGAAASVKLWAPEMPHPHFHEYHKVNAIEPAQGRVPYGGVLVFIGVYFNIGDWLAYAQPSRVIFLYNTFEAPMVFERAREVWERCGVRAEMLYCSDMMQHEVGLPGLFEPSPTDIVAFSPRAGQRTADHKFTLGRHSRDVMEKHHTEDWKVYEAVSNAGGTSQVLGGTCMSALYPSIPGLDLLPARSGDMVPFLQSLDCYFYRTSTWIEPWGRVVIEAMACGLPVIASRNGGYAQVIEHGVNGLLFDTTEEAVDLINQVIADPDLRYRLGKAARKTVEELLGDAAMRRLVSFYLVN